jgi:PD-(D/E)XK nuclease family transposase
MMLGIDPKADYAFKHMLGRDSTRPILIHVLQSVLHPPPGGQIRDVELLNPFNPKETLDDKLSILDIKARDQAGRPFPPAQRSSRATCWPDPVRLSEREICCDGVSRRVDFNFIIAFPENGKVPSFG